MFERRQNVHEVKGSTYLYNVEGSGVGLEWVSGQDLPVVEHALREGLASCIAAEIGGETCNTHQTTVTTIPVTKLPLELNSFCIQDN